MKIPCDFFTAATQDRRSPECGTDIFQETAHPRLKIELLGLFGLNFLKMKCCTSLEDIKLMDTRVLMPAEFSLVVSPRPLPPLDRLVPLEDSIKVCATITLPPNTRYLPFSGTVRADYLPLLPYLQPLDLRVRYGGYDAVDEEGRRTCNWVRFLRVTAVYTSDVTIVGRRIGSEVVFDVIREVEAGAELLAFLLPECGPTGEDTNLLLPALQLLRSSLYKRTIDSIMAETPLDLSKSLLTSPSRSRDRHSPGRGTPSPTHSDESLGVSLKSSPASSPEHTPHFPPSPPSFLSRPPYFLPQHSRPLAFPSPSLLSPHAEFRFPNFMAGRFSGLTPPASPNTTATTTVSSLSPSCSSGLERSLSNSSLSMVPIKRRERTMLPCSECGKTFDRPSLLKRHMRTHTGEKPHVCDVCGKGFSTSSSLNTHRRIHSGEKPHQCGVCGKRFTASSNLYYHKMTHVKEKPHKCSLCTRSFPTPGDLRSHMFVHNGQWPHKCGVCGKGFSKLTNLRNHTILHSTKTRVPSPPPSPDHIPMPIENDNVHINNIPMYENDNVHINNIPMYENDKVHINNFPSERPQSY